MTNSIALPITSNVSEQSLTVSVDAGDVEITIKEPSWACMFSQSGSEIAGICKKLNRKPTVIFTNNMKDETWHPYIKECNVAAWHHDSIMSFLDSVEPGGWIITLHGYLRIIPADVCNVFEMYNGHPGDIITYPQLKGKDPQKKALELGLPSTGTIIHKVTPGVDEGKILRIQHQVITPGMTEEELINELKIKSIDLWVDFLQTRLLLG